MPPQTPPIAPRHPHTLTMHGHSRMDEYYWLRNREDPAVIAYLEAENSYTEASMAHTAALQETLFQEMRGRIQETDVSVPVQIDDYFYYFRTEEGLQYPIYCRKQGSLAADETVLLDLNALAQEHDYLRLGIYQVSPNHELLAYSLDTSGYEQFTLYFKHLPSGEVLADELLNTGFTAVWGNDSRTLFYTVRDHANRVYRLLRHTLGSPPAGDDLLFDEPDELFRVGVTKSRDNAYILRHSSSIETSEIAFLDANTPAGSFTILQPRQKGLEYDVQHHQGTFYIRTNDQATNFKVVTAAVSQPGRAHWRELLPHRPHVLVDGLDLFAKHLVIHERENGLKTLRITDLATQETHYVEFPEPVYTYTCPAADNPTFHTHQLRFTYMSLTTPDSVYDYDMAQRGWHLLKRKEVLGGYDPAGYQSQRIFAPAADGTLIPISLVHRKDTPLNANTPCLLYGYGSYGYSMDPAFNSNRLSLLDRGIVYAIAHIRGGQEMGRQWYEQGKFLHKMNTFTDFIACGRHLINQGYTSPGRLAIMGGSAGGLLMGAVLNLAPDLCHAAVAAVPFVDVVTTMLDESIPLTVGEYEEWGNPNDPDYYHYMLSYSPYDNIAPHHYPHLLITAGLNDPRVQYWEPAKWAARLRATGRGDNHLLLKTNMGAGHGGASGRYDYLKEWAFIFAFLLDTLAIA